MMVMVVVLAAWRKAKMALYVYKFLKNLTFF